MIKIIISFILFFISTTLIYGDLEVKSNINSGTFDSVLEIYLISNDKESKIFYYTDKEGRMDHIIEYKNLPIIIKDDTTLNFFANGDNYKSTKIKEEIYNINYSPKVDLDYKNGKIKIYNLSNEILNLGYWVLESNNLSYEIKPNSYIKSHDFYELDYTLKDSEKIKLFYPNNKLAKEFIYKIPIITKVENNSGNILTGETVLENSLIKNNSGDIFTGISNIEKSQNNLIQNNSGDIFKDTKQININQEIKTSILDKKTNDNIFLKIIIGFAIFSIIIFMINIINIFTQKK